MAAVRNQPKSIQLSLTLVFCLIGGTTQAQLLYSFETGLDGFEMQGGSDSDYINHAQSTIGATDGSMALEVETGPGFGRDIVVNETLAWVARVTTCSTRSRPTRLTTRSTST